MNAYDVTIEHAIVITMDRQRRIIKDGAVAIRGDRIAAVDHSRRGALPPSDSSPQVARAKPALRVQLRDVGGLARGVRASKVLRGNR